MNCELTNLDDLKDITKVLSIPVNYEAGHKITEWGIKIPEKGLMLVLAGEISCL